MKVLLIQNVKNLGKKNEIKDVSEGYARNFLIPKKLAQAATEGAIRNVEILKAKEREEEAANLEKWKELAKKLENREIKLEAKEKGGKLFGSITAKNITQALENSGFDILEKSIIMKEAIRKTGEYKIEIKLAQNISARINLKVEGN